MPARHITNMATRAVNAEVVKAAIGATTEGYSASAGARNIRSLIRDLIYS
jgi:hypothetical protein